MKHIKRIFDICEIKRVGNNKMIILNNEQEVGYLIINFNFESFYGKIYRYERALVENGFNYNIEDGVELVYLYIDGSFRKRGYAKESIINLIKYLQSTDKFFIILEASDDNTEKSILLNLYKKCGFNHISTDDGDYMIYQLK